MIEKIARQFCGHTAESFDPVRYCEHEWKTEKVTVAAPMTDLPTTDTYTSESEHRFLCGVTSVLRVCSKGCGSQEVVEMLGVPKE